MPIKGYAFGTRDKLGHETDLYRLDEIQELIDETFGEFNEDTLLLKGWIYSSEEFWGSVNEVAFWDELRLPYSFEKLLEAQRLALKARQAINKLGNQEEYRWDERVQIVRVDSHPTLHNYPQGDCVLGLGVAAYLGAELPSEILDRFNFYAHYSENHSE